MRTAFTVFGVLTALLAAGGPAAAHHSFAAEFDANKPVKLTGVVTKVEWTNPHVWFYIDVADDTGRTVTWAWELGSPNGLVRSGWTRNSLKVGESVTVEGSGSRDGTPTANTRLITLTSTGQKLFGASSQPAAR